MKKRDKLGLLLLLGTATIGVILLAGGLSGLQLQPGEPFPFWLFFDAAAPGSEGLARGSSFLDLIWRILVTALLFVVLPLWLIIFIISPRARKHMLSKLPAYILWAIIIYMLARALQRLEPLWRGTEPSEAAFSSPLAALADSRPLEPPTFVVNPPPWLITALTMGVIVLLTAIAWFIWQRTRHREPPLTSVVREAQQALKKLQGGSNITDTIMRCYFEMSRVLSQQRGIQRHKAMTPREFEQHLARIGLEDEHIGRLTRLFERVRYGAGLTGDKEESEAVACLSAIVETYGGSS